MKLLTLNKKKLISYILNNAVIVILLIFVAFMMLTNKTFASWENITNIFAEFTVYGIAACAMTILLISGEFDLSASSVFAVSTVLFVDITNRSGPLVALVLVLLTGTAIGALNGWLVAKIKIAAFIATMGTMTIFKGFAFFYTNGNPINTDNEVIKRIGSFNFAGGITITTIVFAVVYILLIFVMLKTRFGRNIYVTGGNIEVARLSGLNVWFYKFIPFVIMGFCAAVSGILYCSRIYAGSAIYGSDLAIYSVAAAVIGGTSLSGGNGGVAKTLVGLLVMSVLFNAMTLMGVEGYFQQLVRGLVLISVIVMDAYINRRK